MIKFKRDGRRDLYSERQRRQQKTALLYLALVLLLGVLVAMALTHL